MGLFGPKVPNTIGDKKWDRIKKGAGKAEARSGGFFGKKAIDQRKTHSKILSQSKKGKN